MNNIGVHDVSNRINIRPNNEIITLVHANILCIVPMLTDDPRRESNHELMTYQLCISIGGGGNPRGSHAEGGLGSETRTEAVLGDVRVPVLSLSEPLSGSETLTLHYITLYYIILHYITLYYIILHYIIL